MAVSPRAQGFLDRWLPHRRALAELVDRLPESAAGYRPWSEAMTTAALVHHIAVTVHRFQTAVAEGGFGPLPGTRPPAPTTLVEVRDLLASTTSDGQRRLGALTDQELDAILTFPPIRLEASGHRVLERALEHEIHHKGQLFVYARMLGVEPGPYAIRG